MAEREAADTSGPAGALEREGANTPAPVPRRGDRRHQLLAIDDRAQFEERRRQVRRAEERERWDAFALWLRDRRRATGLSQAQCARIAGMGQAQWNRIENSVHGTPREKVAGIAKAVGAPLSEALRAADYGDVLPSDVLTGGDGTAGGERDGQQPAASGADAPATRGDLERMLEGVYGELREIRRLLSALAGKPP